METMDNIGALRLPFPSFEIFFKCMEINNTNFKAKCKLCLPKTNILSCHVKASSNLRKHLEKKHPNSIEKLQEQNIFRRKRKSFNESDTEINRKTIKQSNIYICSSDVGQTSTVSQDTVDQLILNFVINSLQPISICDKSSKDGVAFNKLITGLQPDASVMCSETLKARLHSALVKTKHAFVETIEQVSWVAVTVDCWSAAKRSFIGVTAHWIDLSSLERRQAALACKQLKGHHTYNVLAKELQVIFEEYKLQKKICGLTTDNGSNFVGVFKVLGEDDTDNSYEEDTSDAEFIEITKILDETHQTTQENTEFTVLPPHMRCASHTLNLIASRDIQKALQISNLKTIWRQTFSKLKALWNKQNTSTLSADIIKQHFDVYLKTPTTRWNSTYDACNQLKVLIDNSLGMDKLHRVCDTLDIPRLEQNEVVFLREYVDVMKPLASALNLLQRENNMYMGYLLPTLYQTVATIKEIKTTRQLQYCVPLICILINSIQLRFQSVWWKRSLVISSCIHPKFKLDWLKSPKKEQAYKWVLEELDDLNYVDSLVEEKVASPSEYFDQDENDFFQFPTTSNSNSETESKRDFDRFLEDNSRNLKMLNKHKLIKQIFLKYNTSLPSSASVVRMFSIAEDVLKTKSYALTDSNFEMQLLLRLNVEYSPLA